MTKIALQKTEEAARQLYKVLVCARCKEGSKELQFLGTICKHAFCWSCINTFCKEQETSCPLCLSMIEPAQSYPAHIINEFAVGLSKFVELIEDYRTAIKRDDSSLQQCTQKVTQILMDMENAPRRKIEDFILTQEMDPGEVEKSSERKEIQRVRSRANSVSDSEVNLVPKQRRKGRKADVLAPIREAGPGAETKPTIVLAKRARQVETPLTRKVKNSSPPRNMLFLTQEMDNLREEIELDLEREEKKKKSPPIRPPFKFTKVPSINLDDEEEMIAISRRENTPPSPELGEITPPPQQATSRQEVKEDLPETLERKAPRRSLTYKKKKFELIETVQENPALAERLIRDGYDVNESNTDQCTPLYFAAMKGNLKLCKLLVENGAIINAHCGKGCNTPLHIAVQNQHSEVVDYLLSKGANKSASNIHGKLPAEMTDFASPVRKMVANYTGRPIQPKIIPRLPEVFVVFIHNVKMSSIFLDRFKDIVRCEDNLTMEVTHVVMMPSENNEEIFDVDIIIIHAMLRGLTIVKANWITECLAHNLLIKDTSRYEIHTTRFRDMEPEKGICKKYREDKQQLKPRLFQGCIFYVLSSRFRSYGTRTVINDIIKLAGGEVTSKEPKVEADPPPYFRKDLGTPYFILYDTDAKISDRILSNPKLHKVSPLWLFECLTKYTFIDPY